MTKKQRSIWDDIAELGREISKKIDEILNPDKRRKPVRVPVPIRRNNPLHDPNNEHYR